MRQRDPATVRPMPGMVLIEEVCIYDGVRSSVLKAVDLDWEFGRYGNRRPKFRKWVGRVVKHAGYRYDMDVKDKEGKRVIRRRAPRLEPADVAPGEFVLYHAGSAKGGYQFEFKGRRYALFNSANLVGTFGRENPVKE